MGDGAANVGSGMAVEAGVTVAVLVGSGMLVAVGAWGSPAPNSVVQYQPYGDPET